ncbi:hypothetical protein [Roseobacter litoralis]|uniref:hypothetical protein n=1 Tax=Roseobacter litoralis TaxID=42443 RepID=UPI0024946B51|nr:hypothetical protein [Roseobacter litoralis]
MLPLHSEKWANAAPEQKLEPDALGFLNYLRFVAMNCRAKPHTDLFEACALLHTEHDKTQQAHAEALMRCLNEALGKPARLYAPGVTEMTFDESWLLQLCLASARQDRASVYFLVQSRVAREHRRLITFLVHWITGRFSRF